MDCGQPVWARKASPEKEKVKWRISTKSARKQLSISAIGEKQMTKWFEYKVEIVKRPVVGAFF
jgi:hypothetical protein